MYMEIAIVILDYRAQIREKKWHVNINFLLWLTSRWPWDKRLVVPGFTGPKIQGDITYAPPPPSPHFWPKGIFQGRGMGVYILSPHAAGILYAPPPFIHPPTPRRVFSGVGGVGVYKIWPRKKVYVFASKHRKY